MLPLSVARGEGFEKGGTVRKVGMATVAGQPSIVYVFGVQLLGFA